MSERKPIKFDELLAREKAVKPKKVQRHQESDIQIACVNWFKLQYRRYVIFAVPNGGTRDKKEQYVYENFPYNSYTINKKEDGTL